MRLEAFRTLTSITLIFRSVLLLRHVAPERQRVGPYEGPSSPERAEGAAEAEAEAAPAHAAAIC